MGPTLQKQLCILCKKYSESARFRYITIMQYKLSPLVMKIAKKTADIFSTTCNKTEASKAEVQSFAVLMDIKAGHEAYFGSQLQYPALVYLL